MSTLSPEQIERIARRRACAKQGWALHAMAWFAVNLFLFALSASGFGHRPWSVYPLLGWGLGLALHGVAVFLLGDGSAWRQRLLQRERERLQREQQRPARP